ncbi:MAG: RNase adapter RapZ [Gracilibacteraceae bacterium]|jgi:UPF0042 nucleotide-binding protein|nr:RNase adapter RapZ [Gracilibacteraceae bacterium]
MEQFTLILLTGLSGAGKSRALQNFEDIGYYCIDNLPPGLLVKFIELCRQAEKKIRRAAVVCDLRGGEFFASMSETVDELRRMDLRLELLFLEASDEVMIHRYKETRRRHPLAPRGSVLDGIKLERGLLAELRGKADRIIDSSDFSLGDMREEIKTLYGQDGADTQMSLSVTSFGFKYGMPPDVDMVADVRFLPNPFYIPELKPLTGLEQPVRDFVLINPLTDEFLARYLELLHFLLPHYRQEGKQHLALAVGCTGGQHRSVALAEHIGDDLRGLGCFVTVKHRDIRARERLSAGDFSQRG